MTFTPADSQVSVTIEISNDVILEGTEYFQGVITLSGVQRGIELQQSVATFWINDDDSELIM